MEQNRRAIIRRLEREGWINHGGAKHDVFTHPVLSERIVLPRHQTISVGVARDAARIAGWR